MKKIVDGKEILVNFMADAIGNGFCSPVAMTGPFASAARAIVVDQAAQVGQSCGTVSTVGKDDFGLPTVGRRAAGTLAVTQRRPMESAAILDEITSFASAQGRPL